MKKTFLLLLIAFGMNASHTSYAQEILGVSPSFDSPCEGTYLSVTVDRSNQSNVDSMIWTKGGSKVGIPAGWNSDPITGNVNCSNFGVANNGNYEITCYMTSGATEMVNIQLSVNPNPNATYNLIPKCFGVLFQPIGADMYYKYDSEGGFTVPFTVDTLTINIAGGGFRAVNNNGCYTDVTVTPFNVPALFALNLVPTKWKILPGQSTTLTASANWSTVMSKTKWYKNGVLFAQGCSSVTVSDTGLYKVSMRATASAGSCFEKKLLRIKEKIVNGLRILEVEESKDFEEEGNFDEVDNTEKVTSQIQKPSTLSVFPNPASSQIQISGYDQTISILDMSGRIIQSREFDTTSSNNLPQIMDVSSLPNGMYLVRSGEHTAKLTVSH